jgi:hypothetical protein
MADQRRKRPRDTNQLAKFIVDVATGEEERVDQSAETESHTSPIADRGRAGGRVGGPARSDALSPERRREIARIAASARWGKKR